MKRLINIAWIDDDIHILEPVVKPLDDEGYRIEKIYSLAEARKKIKNNDDFDLIILDLILPDIGLEKKAIKYPGKDYLKELRTVLKISTPVVIFSVVNRGIILQQLKDFGVDDIIQKPVKPSYLKSRIESVLRNHKLIQ